MILERNALHPMEHDIMTLYHHCLVSCNSRLCSFVQLPHYPPPPTCRIRAPKHPHTHTDTHITPTHICQVDTYNIECQVCQCPTCFRADEWDNGIESLEEDNDKDSRRPSTLKENKPDQ